MAGGANGSRVAEYTQDSGLILASVTRLRGGCKFGGLGFVWWSATRGKRQRQMPAHQMCYLLLPDLSGINCYRIVALLRPNDGGAPLYLEVLLARIEPLAS